MADRLTADIITDLLRYAEAAAITSQHAALHREAARRLDELMELLDESQTGWKRELKENARLSAALAGAEQATTDARLTTVWWAYDDSEGDAWEANAVFGDEQHALAYALDAWAKAERNRCADHDDEPDADCEDCQGMAAYVARLEWRKVANRWELWDRGDASRVESQWRPSWSGVTVAPNKVHWPEALAADVPAAPLPAGFDTHTADLARQAVAAVRAEGDNGRSTLIRTLKIMREEIRDEGGDYALKRLIPYAEWALSQPTASPATAACDARLALERIADEIPKLDGLDEERLTKGLEWIHRVATGALTGQCTHGHYYLSTACNPVHDLHEPECGAAQRARGDNSHPHCKYCGAKCVCGCHTGGQVERAERVHVDGCTLAADNPHHAGWCRLDAGVPAAGEAEHVDHAIPGGRYAWRIEFYTGAYWETFDQGIWQSVDLNAQGVAEATAERVEELPEQSRPAWRVLVWPVLAEPKTDKTAIARVTSAGKRLGRRLARPAPVAPVSGSGEPTKAGGQP